MLKKIIIISLMVTIGSQAKAFDEQEFTALDIFKIARSFPSQVTSEQRCDFMMKFAYKIESFPKEDQNDFIMGTLLAIRTVLPENADTYDPMIKKLKPSGPNLKNRSNLKKRPNLKNEHNLKSKVEAEISSKYPWYKKA